MLLDTFSTFGFTQLVDTPTRGSNILDIFATNRPGLIQEVTVSPGLSDHELIIVESFIVATLTESQPQSVYLRHQANWQALHERLSYFSNNFFYLTTLLTHPFKNCGTLLSRNVIIAWN